jgi:hypothetical protein
MLSETRGVQDNGTVENEWLRLRDWCVNSVGEPIIYEFDDTCMDIGVKM